MTLQLFGAAVDKVVFCLGVLVRFISRAREQELRYATWLK